MLEHPLQPAANRLLARVQRRYPTVAQTIELGKLSIRFTRIADPDRVLDDVAAEEDRRQRIPPPPDAPPLSLPYWAELWESAIAVGEHLCRRTDSGRTLHALDLGCGMGLAGTVAARLGMNVLFADLEPFALLLARLNSLPDRDRVRTRRLDWRRDHLGENFDIILGADILYESAQWDYLEPFWRAHLRQTGVVVLGEPGRQSGDQFFQWIAPRGWDLTQSPYRVRDRQVRVLELRLAHER